MEIQLFICAACMATCLVSRLATWNSGYLLFVDYSRILHGVKLLTSVVNVPLKLLLERGASLESKDEEGAIPLHDACAGGGANFSANIFH